MSHSFEKIVGRTARRMAPTLKHKPILWECLLGTAFAANSEGEVKYCDYRDQEAREHIDPSRWTDFRLAEQKRRVSFYNGKGPKVGQFCLFGLPVEQPNVTVEK